MEQKTYIPYVTIGLVVVNVIIYIVMEIQGDTQSTLFMLEHGAMYPPYVVEEGEWWRLITCTFLHFGIRHLANNMIVLGVMGMSLERMLGHGKYLVFYLLCGVIASGASLGYMLFTGDYAVSAGASGAIFGIVGGLLALAILSYGHLRQNVQAYRLLFYIAISVYLGFSSTGVDVMAHVGGVVAGLLLCGIYGLIYGKRHEIQFRL